MKVKEFAKLRLPAFWLIIVKSCGKEIRLSTSDQFTWKLEMVSTESQITHTRHYHWVIGMQTPEFHKFSLDTPNIFKGNIFKLEFAWMWAVDKAREIGEGSKCMHIKIGSSPMLLYS